MQNSQLNETTWSKTKYAVFANAVLNEPFICLFSLLAFILTKHLHATAFQISVLKMLGPTVAVLSFYWSSQLSKKRHSLTYNLFFAKVFAVLPFVFFPFFKNTWFFIISSGLYMLFSRAAMPAFMEILKRNISQKPRQLLFSRASILEYAEGVVIGTALGMLLDYDADIWKILFCIGALLYLSGALFLSRIPICEDLREIKEAKYSSLSESLISPLKESLRLIRERKDFAFFQCGFMIGGFGLMLAMPAIPFFLTSLDFSYTDFAISITLCKGLGFILGTPLWTRITSKVPLNIISCTICSLFGVFFVFLLMSQVNPAFLFFAYFFYGFVQAGSHFTWHISGTIFSGSENSSPYSTVNVLTVGMRGLIAPPLGGLLCDYFSPVPTIGIGMLLCFCGGIFLLLRQKKPAAIAV